MLQRFILSLLLLTGVSCLGKHDGRYLRDLTMDYATPHQEWASKLNGGTIKTLFIVSRMGAREAVEAAERMEISLNAVSTANARTLANDNMYESAVEGTSVYEKTQELMTRLDQKYDLFVLGNFSFDLLPPEAQLKILRQVMNGSGLVIVYPYTTKLNKIFAKPVAAGAREIYALADRNGLMPKLRDIPEDVMLNTYDFGKGRIARIDYKANHPAIYYGLALTAPNVYSNRWQAEYENNMVLLMRAMKWAAQREPQISIACPELTVNPVLQQKVQNLKIDLKSSQEFNGNIELRLRDEFNNVLENKDIPCKFSGAGSIDFAVPQLAGGRYYLDIIAKSGGRTDNFGYRSFVVATPVKIDVASTDVIRQHGVINAGLKVENAPANCEVEISLTDSPYGRVWYRQTYNLNNVGTLPIKIENYYMPTLAGYLKCAVMQNGRPLAVREKLLYFPDYRLEDYLEYCWGSVEGAYLAPFYADRIVDGLGWRAGLTHPQPEGVNIGQAALLNQRSVPYVVRIMLQCGEKGEVRQGNWSFLPKSQLSEQKALNGDESFASPEVKNLWREMVNYRIKNLSCYSPVIYNLGDENTFSYDSGFGKADRVSFMDFLKQKYVTIEALNQEYKSSYKLFDEVKHMTQQEAKDQKNFPAWYDHRQYMEKMYADLHHFLAQEIKKYDPDAKVGAEGSVPGDLEQTIKGLEFWGPYSDLVMDEVLRSIAPEKIRTLWWGGYVGSHGGRNQYPLPLWKDLLTGNVNGSAWFASYVASEGALGIDMDYAHYVKTLIPYLLQLQNGQAQLLINTPLARDGIAILWSHASDSARLLDPKCINPSDSAGTFIRFCYANALNFDFLTESMLDKLKNYKVLCLFGASSIDARTKSAILDYVKNGGIVIADANPGILNSFLRPAENNQLKELFGNVTYAGTSAPEMRELKLNSEFNGKMLRLQAERAGVIANVKPFTVTGYGKGQCVLLNFTLSGAGYTSSKAASLNNFLLDLFSAAGIKPPAQVSGIVQDEVIIRVRAREGFRLIGLMTGRNDIGKTAVITLAQPAYIYDPETGFIKQGDKVEIKLDKPFKLVSCFDRRQVPPEIALAAENAVAGKPVTLSLQGFAPGTVLLLEIKDPSGKLMPLRKQVITVGKQNSASIYFAFNDRPGNYVLMLTDIATGLKSEKSILLYSARLKIQL